MPPAITATSRPSHTEDDVDAKLDTVHVEKPDGDAVVLPSAVSHLQAEADWIASLSEEEFQDVNRKLVRKVSPEREGYFLVLY
jgi:hypothetical protein